MVVVGENQGASKAPVALLDDARKRREQHTAASDAPRHPTREEPGEDYSGYALDLAESLLTGDSGPASSATPDEILAQHQVAATSAPSSPVGEPRQEPEADEILLALQTHHRRAQPSAPPATPLGSAELAPHRAQRKRSATPKAYRPPRSLTRRGLVAGGVIVIAAAAAVLGLALSTSTTGGRPYGHRFDTATTNPIFDLTSVANKALAAVAAADRGVNASIRAHDTGVARVRRRPTSRTHTRAVRGDSSDAQAAHTASGTPASVGAAAAPVVNAGQTAAPSSVSYSSAGSSSAYSPRSVSSEPQNPQLAATSGTASQPAGPSGPGSTVGSNCNPKCS
jgi:hypothetical protein